MQNGGGNFLCEFGVGWAFVGKDKVVGTRTLTIIEFYLGSVRLKTDQDASNPMLSYRTDFRTFRIKKS